MDLSHFVGDASVIQYALGSRRLPSIDVGHDANITNFFYGYSSGHSIYSQHQEREIHSSSLSYPSVVRSPLSVAAKPNAICQLVSILPYGQLTTNDGHRCLPPVVRKGLIRFSHAVSVFLLFN